MTAYINPFTGQTISPSQVGYESISITTSSVQLEWPVNGNNLDVVANIIDVSTTNTAYGLILPSAEAVSTGQSILINNIGSITVQIFAQDGTTEIGSVPASTALYFWLTDNTTLNGTWNEVTFGAGTSSANANALAGYGLTAFSNTLNQSYPITNYYSNTTLGATNRAQFLVWSSGVGTFTLPTSSSLGNNWFCMIRNNGTGILTLTPSGTDTIDGNANEQLQITESLVIVSNGSTGYNTFAYGRSNLFVYTQLSLLVTGGTTTLSNSQASNTIQEYTGTLTSNQIIVLPSTVNIYSLNNLTTGSYTLTFKTAVSGGSTVSVPQNQTLIVICDGTNVYNANSGVLSSLTAIVLNPGSATVPAIGFTGDLETGIYQASTGQVNITLEGTESVSFTSTGIKAPIGVVAGSF